MTSYEFKAEILKDDLPILKTMLSREKWGKSDWFQDIFTPWGSEPIQSIRFGDSHATYLKRWIDNEPWYGFPVPPQDETEELVKYRFARAFAMAMHKVMSHQRSREIT